MMRKTETELYDAVRANRRRTLFWLGLRVPGILSALRLRRLEVAIRDLREAERAFAERFGFDGGRAFDWEQAQ